MKKIFLVTILSLTFVFGMFSSALAQLVPCTTNADCGSGKECKKYSQFSSVCRTIIEDEDVFYCLVRNDPNNCKVFTINNNTDFNAAVTACDNKSTDPIQGGLKPGKCPVSTLDTSGGPLAGATPEALKGQAAGLNKLGITDIPQLVGRFINILMAFIGSISLVLYIYSGFLWMTASGNTEQVGKAKNIMVWTTLGVVVMLASYMLASFIFKSLGV